MAKLYLDKSEFSQQEELVQALSALVKIGIEKQEKQGDFESLYDIEIKGVTVYYEKHWHYDGLTSEETK